MIPDSTKYVRRDIMEYCPNCGTRLLLESKYCHKCGFFLNGVTNLEKKSQQKYIKVKSQSSNVRKGKFLEWLLNVKLPLPPGMFFLMLIFIAIVSFFTK
jgi:uncharacterized membrane protein YvbJ